MLQPEIDLRSTENARKRQNGKLSAWGSHLGHWGELRRRGLISGCGELELGTSWNGDNERRRAAAVPSGGKVDAELAEVVTAEAFLCWHSRAREIMVRWEKQRG